MEGTQESISVPRGIKLLAYLFMLVGVGGAMNMVLDPILYSNFHLDPAIVLVFASIGLLRGRYGWRQFGNVAVAFMGIVSILVLGLLVYKAFLKPGLGGSLRDWSVFGPVVVTALQILLILFLILLICIAYWSLRVLNNPTAKAFFKNPVPPYSVDNRTRITLIVAACVAVILSLTEIPFVRWDNPLDNGFSTAIPRNVAGPPRMAYCGYGHRFGKLAYVVLVESNGPVSNPIQRVHSFKSTDLVLGGPDGAPIPLPNRIQLYEIVDGKFRQDEKRVTREQFEAFLDSSPTHYTIDSLLEFAESTPE